MLEKFASFIHIGFVGQCLIEEPYIGECIPESFLKKKNFIGAIRRHFDHDEN
jgi:hypothetical protein